MPKISFKPLRLSTSSGLLSGSFRCFAVQMEINIFEVKCFHGQNSNVSAEFEWVCMDKVELGCSNFFYLSIFENISSAAVND